MTVGEGKGSERVFLLISVHFKWRQVRGKEDRGRKRGSTVQKIGPEFPPFSLQPGMKMSGVILLQLGSTLRLPHILALEFLRLFLSFPRLLSQPPNSYGCVTFPPTPLCSSLSPSSCTP